MQFASADSSDFGAMAWGRYIVRGTQDYRTSWTATTLTPTIPSASSINGSRPHDMETLRPMMPSPPTTTAMGLSRVASTAPGPGRARRQGKLLEEAALPCRLCQVPRSSCRDR